MKTISHEAVKSAVRFSSFIILQILLVIIIIAFSGKIKKDDFADSPKSKSPYQKKVMIDKKIRSFKYNVASGDLQDDLSI